LKLDQQESNKGFKLDGDVNKKIASSYVENELEKNRRKPRLVIAFLSILLICSVIWGAISQFRVLQNRVKMDSVDFLESDLNKAMAVAKKSAYVRDSLENVIFRLKTENDLLAENTDPPIGIFFEVQIASFRDFNLDQYNKNLANLRQEKYHGKTKFLLGRFKSFKKALVFESDLKRLGINNAFVVGRIDDRIVTYREALDAIGSNNK